MHIYVYFEFSRRNISFWNRCRSQTQICPPARQQSPSLLQRASADEINSAIKATPLLWFNYFTCPSCHTGIRNVEWFQSASARRFLFSRSAQHIRPDIWTGAGFVYCHSKHTLNETKAHPSQAIDARHTSQAFSNKIWILPLNASFHGTLIKWKAAR